ncbi:hypothetical protein N9F14_01665, partial [bacterium]|nr:hypothetical protein [bacterium]
LIFSCFFADFILFLDKSIPVTICPSFSISIECLPFPHPASNTLDFFLSFKCFNSFFMNSLAS